LLVEKLEWETGFGPPTRAVFMKPEGSTGPLPGVLALHDHGGIKYYGKSKIVRISEEQHPFLKDHQETYYDGLGWASELVRRGYGVLVHDAFPFESRKIVPSRLPGYTVKRMMSHPEDVYEMTPEDLQDDQPITRYDIPDNASTEEIDRYNAFGEVHEHIIAKALFSAGLTWPGIYISDDRCALSYLAAREDIDANRLGCGGLSGGGMRTNYLASVDDRIACCFTAGFMTTWQDFAFNTCYTHTWMVYVPLLPRLMDYPDILGMRVPKPTMVLATKQDPLYTLEETEKAGKHLAQIFEKAGKSENFRMNFYEGAHRFDLQMQKDSFAWFDRWLK
jgi:dienelactone hydrolase